MLLATRSEGKVRELRPLFAAHDISVIDLREAGIVESKDEDDLEIYSTFEENAVAKATYFHERSGLPTVADDSGLAVRALAGRPGVHSKRWSGRSDLSGQALDDENNRLLMSSLAAAVDRVAWYVCAAAYVDRANTVVRRGEVTGLIVDEPLGANGFGYDPYFFSDELRRTFGDASIEEKERVSHRGRAFRALIAALVG